MKAIVQNRYGSPDVLELKEIDKPVVEENDVLVRAHAATLHAGDIFAMRGDPFVARMGAGWPKPKDHIPGYDVAGRVEAVGKNVTRYQEAGKATPVSDRTYPLSETPVAFCYLGEGHARGKIVIPM